LAHDVNRQARPERFLRAVARTKSASKMLERVTRAKQALES